MPSKSCRSPHKEFGMSTGWCRLDRSGQAFNGDSGEIGADIVLAMRRDRKEQQAGAATNLEHAMRLQLRGPRSAVWPTYSCISADGSGWPCSCYPSQ